MPLNVISYAYGRASKNPDSEEGPSLIQASPALKARNLSINWLKTLRNDDPRQGLGAKAAVTQINSELAKETKILAQKGERFLTLGGDHSSGIGTWSGAASGLEGPLGLLWIDAHLDSHTPQTSISKNIHGMPLAILLGFGDPELCHIQNPKPKISPKNLVVLGARSFEEGEEKLLKKLGVRVFYMEDIEREGLNSVMKKAFNIVQSETSAFGISIDIDAVDPEDAPGVASKEPNGIRARELLLALKPLIKDPHFIGAEIAEFNPSLDKEHKTEQLIIDLIELLC